MIKFNYDKEKESYAYLLFGTCGWHKSTLTMTRHVYKILPSLILAYS